MESLAGHSWLPNLSKCKNYGAGKERVQAVGGISCFMSYAVAVICHLIALSAAAAAAGAIWK
jgi:hypothetical protein